MNTTLQSREKRTLPLGQLLKTNIRDYAMYIVLVVLFVVFGILTNGLFLSPRNLTDLINQTGYVAVLAIGYADGLPRTLTGGQVLLHGCRAPIVGRICMDQTLVDVAEIPAVDPGDVAVLLGTSGQETITAYDLAQQAGTITNEILSRLGPRLERIVR